MHNITALLCLEILQHSCKDNYDCVCCIAGMVVFCYMLTDLNTLVMWPEYS